MTDIVERLKKIPPREVCEHWSQRAKCPYCEVADLEADNERLRAALRDIYDAFEELSNADVDQSVKEFARGVIHRANRWQES